ncbi:hypothetical protein SAMN05421493_1178 [Pseudobutyrivibrio sp. 49]|uniref:DUF5688 family protein n=1 Tax=Pseudobutyrivibrio sp. 49 TaxID=1855344 RepID=UPI000880E783|nr:DUF5688 family protein [Pseudobutyrivibrio sp. 49]SDI51760.1 hypothetical protein SAMN05421493_1178 [Pseudobutyrivibrio sp. 49]
MKVLEYVSGDFKVNKEEVTSREYILSHVRACVVPDNDIILNTDVVRTNFLDLAVIYKVVVNLGSNEHIGAYNLNYDIMTRAGITESELFDTVKAYKDFTLTPIMSAIMDYFDAPADEYREIDFSVPDIYVMTTKDRIFGATAMFSDALRNLQDKISKDLVIIPCSKMEILVLIYHEDIDIAAIKKLVKSINSNESLVSAEEFLSNSVYLLNSSGLSILA